MAEGQLSLACCLPLTSFCQWQLRPPAPGTSPP